ncbi:MAG: hypothetical protein LBR08_03925 [Bacteroidales bacterium]|jgi:hypothetical protein|nr:hypothetical protein [Bacteroidales bacterium]
MNIRKEHHTGKLAGTSCKGITVNVKSGAENIFDKRYSTCLDWNNIPRKGRFFYSSGN